VHETRMILNKTLKKLLKDDEDHELLYTSATCEGISYPDDGNQNCYLIENNSFWFSHRNNCIIQTIKHFPPPGTIFDVGGGNGFVSLGIKQAGFEVALIEPGHVGARNARKRGIAPVICGKLEDVGFDANSIPAVGLFDVLEHLEDDQKFLMYLLEKLQPGGFIYATVPAYKFLWSEIDELSGHKKRYTLQSLNKLFRESGYDVEYLSYIFVPLPLGILLLRVLGPKRRLSDRNRNSRSRSQHQGMNPFFRKILELSLRFEYLLIKRLWRIPFGSSCVVVAQKRES